MPISFAKHIEALKVYLDTGSSAEAIRQRMVMIENVLAIKPGEAGAPNRGIVLGEMAFMVRSKEPICGFLGEERYLNIFQNAVKFLEKNPEPPKAKMKKGKVGDVLTFKGFSSPAWDAIAGTVTWSSPQYRSDWTYTVPQEQNAAEAHRTHDAMFAEYGSNAEDQFGSDAVEGMVSDLAEAFQEPMEGQNDILRTLQDLTRAIGEARSYNDQPTSLDHGAPLETDTEEPQETEPIIRSNIPYTVLAEIAQTQSRATRSRTLPRRRR